MNPTISVFIKQRERLLKLSYAILRKCSRGGHSKR